MKKRIYRATKVKKLNLEKLQEQVDGREIVLAVDVAKEDFFAVIVGNDQQVYATIKWKHPVESHFFLNVILKELSWSSLEVVMEPSGTYGDSLRSQFLNAGIPVYRVSPKRCHDAAEVFDGVPSMHDAKASAIIGRLHQQGLSKEWPMPDDAQRELTASIKTYEIYDSAYHRNINKLEGLVMRFWPELTQFLDLQSATLLELLIAYGVPDRVAANQTQARKLMFKVGNNFLVESKREAILESASSSLGVKSVKAEQEQVQELCLEIRRLQQLCRQAKRRVESLTQGIDSVRNMSVVLGKMTAAVLYIVLGDMQKYSNAGSVVKTLGLNLKEHSSGRHKGQLRITKRGSGLARMYLYFAVLRLIQKDAVIKAWYQKKLQRDGKVKKKAIIAIMRKLASALWYVGQGAKFDSSKLFDVNKLTCQSV